MLRAFSAAVQQIAQHWNVIGKLDADIRFNRYMLATIEYQLLTYPPLGIAGTYLTVPVDGASVVRERCPAGHVRGAAKVDRRERYERVSPLRPTPCEIADRWAARRVRPTASIIAEDERYSAS